MIFSLSSLVISLAVLVWGADKFVESSSLVAKKLGLSELTIGLTIVALGTSAPEIFVGISSVLNGSEALAMGTVIGSNISNMALIFGVSCIGITLIPSKTSIVQFVPLIIGTVILGISLADLTITSNESWGFLFVFALFLFITYKFRTPHQEIVEDIDDTKIGSTLAFLVIGLLALIGGSNFAVVHAEAIALMLNVPELIIGLTIIAIGTSLPELAATISAIAKNKNDMVIGNVIGSNVMNIALVGPIIGFFSNAKFDSTILFRDYFVMAVVTVFFIIIAATYSSKRIKINLIRLFGCIFVLGYLGYILSLSNLI